MPSGPKGSQITELGRTTIIIYPETRLEVYLQSYLSLSKRLQVVVVSLVP